jgi:PAP2 superfamily
MLRNVIAESAFDRSAEASAPQTSRPVHYALAACSAILLVFSVLAAPPGAMTSAQPLIITVVLLTGPLLVPAAMLHERKKTTRRDAVLMLPWTLLIALLIVQAAPTTATFAYPLRDGLWRGIDQHIGMNIPAIMAFARAHPAVNSILFYSYAFALHPLMLCAILLPPVLGDKEAAQRFVLANAFSFVLALPFMIFLPAVGPWVGWGFPPDRLQQSCQATIYALRHGSLIIKDSFGGIVCLPSFHVFWAVISAHALARVRFLRYPAIIVAALITVSTMTTGWHYGVDVIAGLLMAVVCTVLANAVVYGRFQLRRIEISGRQKQAQHLQNDSASL